jgi:WD40 repeat protein
VAFSPDGKALAAGYAASGFGKGGVVLWAAARRQWLPAEPLPVPEGEVLSVAFSPDGKTLAAGYDAASFGKGGGVVLWDAARRQRLAAEPLPVPEGGVRGVAFSSDGKTLAAGYLDKTRNGSVVLWDVDLDSWRPLAGQIANRNLTRSEWQLYFPGTPYRRTFADLPEPPDSQLAAGAPGAKGVPPAGPK